MVGEGAADDGDGSGGGNNSHVDSAEVNFKGVAAIWPYQHAPSPTVSLSHHEYDPELMTGIDTTGADDFSLHLADRKWYEEGEENWLNVEARHVSVTSHELRQIITFRDTDIEFEDEHERELGVSGFTGIPLGGAIGGFEGEGKESGEEGSINIIDMSELYSIPAVNFQTGESSRIGIAEGSRDAGDYSNIFENDSYGHLDAFDVFHDGGGLDANDDPQPSVGISRRG